MSEPLRGLQNLAHISARPAVIASLCADGCKGVAIAQRRRLILWLVHFLLDVHPGMQRGSCVKHGAVKVSGTMHRGLSVRYLKPRKTCAYSTALDSRPSSSPDLGKNITGIRTQSIDSLFQQLFQRHALRIQVLYNLLLPLHRQNVTWQMGPCHSSSCQVEVIPHTWARQPCDCKRPMTSNPMAGVCACW